jgi:hypothetical protein
MKRVGILLACVCFVVLGVGSAHAWFGAKKKEASQEVVSGETKAKGSSAVTEQAAAPTMDKATEKAFKDKWEAAKKKTAQLNNSEWQIEMVPASGKGKKEIETLTFKDGKISAGNFGKKGYSATNFSVTVEADGSVVWETMQTAEKGGICFWRGELDKAMTTMRGVLSNKVDEKSKFDYTFASVSRKSLPADK